MISSQKHLTNSLSLYLSLLVKQHTDSWQILHRHPGQALFPCLCKKTTPLSEEASPDDQQFTQVAHASSYPSFSYPDVCWESNTVVYKQSTFLCWVHSVSWDSCCRLCPGVVLFWTYSLLILQTFWQLCLQWLSGCEVLGSKGLEQEK